MFKKNVLFIGAHPDDLTITCGGIIQKLIREEHVVKCLCVTYYTRQPRHAEFKHGMKMLGVDDYLLGSEHDTHLDLHGVVSLLEKYLSTREIDTIFTHWHGCIHQDHRVVSEASRIVARKGNINLVYYKDSRYHLSHMPWKPNLFYQLNPFHDEPNKKLKSINCHESQLEKNKKEFSELILPNILREEFQLAYYRL